MFDQNLIGQACASAVDTYGDFGVDQRLLILNKALMQRNTSVKKWRSLAADALMPSTASCPFPAGATKHRVSGLAQALVKRYDRLCGKPNAPAAALAAAHAPAPAAAALAAPAVPHGPLPCPKCSKSFQNIFGLNEHVKHCKGPKAAPQAPTMHTCGKCGETKGSAEGLAQHEVHCRGPKPAPQAPTTHTCGKCGATKGSAEGLVQHELHCRGPKTPHPSPAAGGRCCMCNELKLTHEGLVQHELHCGGPRERVAPTPCLCAKCGETLASQEGYDQHVLHCKGTTRAKVVPPPPSVRAFAVSRSKTNFGQRLVHLASTPSRGEWVGPMECILAFVPSLFLSFSLLSWHVREAMVQHRRQCRLAALGLAPLCEDDDAADAPSIDAQLAIPAPPHAVQDDGADDVDVPPVQPVALAPMQPPVFPITCPNPLFHKEGLRVQWSTDPFAKDTDKQNKLAAEYIKALRAHPNMGYFPSAAHAPEPSRIMAKKINMRVEPTHRVPSRAPPLTPSPSAVRACC